MRAGTFTWVLLLSALLAGAAWLLLGRSAPPPDEGRLLFPELRAELGGAREIEITTHEQSFTLELVEDRWRLRELHGYPAQAATVRRFLLGVAGLQIRSRKTSNPDLYARVDLNEPEEEGSQAVRIAIRAEDGGDLAAFLAGRIEPASEIANPDPERGESRLKNLKQIFVRLPDAPTVWLVEGALEIGREPMAFVKREGLADISRETIRSVRVRQPGGGGFTVSRPAQGEDFALQGIPAGRLHSQERLDDLVALFVALDFEQVTAADEVEWGGVRATMTAFDKLQVVMEHSGAAAEPWIRLRAEAPADAAEDSAQATRAAELNRRWQGWAYRLPAGRTEILRREKAALLK